jgi:hypothetical protein
MEYEGHEMDTPETRKTEKLQFMCRRRADVGSFRMPSPPSNDEVEVLGIEVRMPTSIMVLLMSRSRTPTSTTTRCSCGTSRMKEASGSTCLMSSA